ncbi:MAG: DUF1592 domain-containing protein [Steroidobacteraceae bacterium]
MRKRHLTRFLLAAAACSFTMAAWSAQSGKWGYGPPAADAAAAQATPASATAKATPVDLVQAKHYWGFLHNYCEKCHNTNDWAGGVAFGIMHPQNIPHDGKIWQKAIQKLSGRLMPPPGNKQPQQAAVNQFVDWLEGDLDRSAAEHPAYVGSVSLHRLNRTEYADAVWSLLHVKVDGAKLLPKDEESGGFDNIADVLSVSSAFINQYLAAARQIAIQAVGNPDATNVSVQYIAPATSGQQLYHEAGLPLGSRGGFAVTHDFPANGEYELNVGNLAAALWVFNQEFKNQIVASYDGKIFWEGNVGGNAQVKAIDQKQDPAVTAINKTLKQIKFHATAGPHTIAVTFVHRDFAESEGRLQQLTPGDAQDEVLRLRSFDIVGPLKITGMSETPSREKIFTCMPHTKAEQEPCAYQIISTLTRQAYRRPINAQDMAPLMSIYADGAKTDGFEGGIRKAITAILASPYFLYRAVPVPRDVEAGSSYHLTDLELASRLSFFIWGTVPDQELITLAEQHRLHEPAVLVAEVRRMLKDPRAITLTTSFAFQWLDVERLGEVKPDPKIFPYVTDPRPLFKEELKLFVNSIFAGDKDVVDLLTAHYTYLNQRLALLYGVNGVRGSNFRRVELTNPDRFGLLGKGAFLMGTSYPTRTAPVLRGQWVLDKIIGSPPDPPPAGVQMTLAVATPGTGKGLTVRQEMVLHRKNPSCFACHGVLDPIGLAFENFDAVGRWRTKDRITGTPVDASSVLPGDYKVNGPADVLKIIMMRPQRFVQTLTKNLMTYALGRNVNYRDMPEIRSIVRKSAKDDYRFSSLLIGIAESPQFQERTAPALTAKPIKTAQVIVP